MSVAPDDSMPAGRLLLSERIRNTLTDEIASGQLEPGLALDEQQLATRFGASRTPVREALRELIASGLIETRSRRGVIVARTTPQRVMEMFEAMAEVEAMCVRIATYRMTPFDRARLIDLHGASEDMVARGDYDAYDAFNRSFHESLYRATQNEFLAEQAIAMRLRLSAFRRTQLREGDRIHHSYDEHAGVIDAIAQCDGELASRRMRAHMLNAATALGRYMEARSGGHVGDAPSRPPIG